ncbi:hypothetical protein MTO96_022448 [Rhipicephalus appendiculatus]
MTTRDLDALITALSRLNYVQLRHLCTTNMLDNFSIVGTSTKERILSQVLANLEGISPLSDRLLCVGGLYCGIAALGNALSPWELYRVNPFKVNLIFFALHRRVARALAIPGYPIAFLPVATSRRRYACIIVPDIVPTTEHCVICLCVWNGLSHLAVWTAESVGREYLRSALASALCGDPEELRIGSYGTLESAYVAARYPAIDRQSPS